MNKLENPAEQLAAVDEFFTEQAQRGAQLHYLEALAA
jgi:hypothetical protein